MLKITKYLRVHILTLLMFTVCVIFRYPAIFYITYAAMILHETAHCAAAVAIGLKIDSMTFLPFGVNLKLKNKMIYSATDEIILYISGPACNILLALLTAFLCKRYNYEILRMFYISNIVLFFMNMLPALPLDGGIITRRLIARKIGYRRASRIMRAVTALTAAALAIAGAAALIHTRFNFSLLLFSLLIAGNIFTEKEKYDVDFVRELMFCKSKNKNKVRHIIADETSTYRDIAEKLDINGYNIVYLTNTDGKITDILTEDQVINHLIDSHVTIS